VSGAKAAAIHAKTSVPSCMHEKIVKTTFATTHAVTMSAIDTESAVPSTPHGARTRTTCAALTT